MITYPEQQQTSKATGSDSVLLNKKNINHYLESYYGREPIKDIPDEVTTFTTLGFFCDEQNTIYPLYNGGLDYGRRTVDLVDDDVISEVILNASTYLYRQLDARGHFTYGHFPVFDNTMTGYSQAYNGHLELNQPVSHDKRHGSCPAPGQRNSLSPERVHRI
ncbi:hypothetical protein Barb6_01553 [Bacteroidales bacterium Barb6]|nr:hypothetical protein Barb6_01553 [Bacteroidales bacterium Barb6]